MQELLEVCLLRCWQPTLPEACPDMLTLHFAVDMCNLLSQAPLLRR